MSQKRKIAAFFFGHALLFLGIPYFAGVIFALGGAARLIGVGAGLAVFALAAVIVWSATAEKSS